MNEIKKIGNIGIERGTYREYFFKYDYYSDETKAFTMKEFRIGNTLISVGNASEDMRESYNISGQKCETIKIHGVSDENCTSVLEQALFYLVCKNPPNYQNEYPRIIDCFETEDKPNRMNHSFDEKIDEMGNEFPLLQHVTAIVFYNCGVGCRNTELGFLYFYKVLEYFFILHNEKKFQILVKNYEMNKDLLTFTTQASKIFRKREEKQLLSLLEVLKKDIGAVLRRAKEEKICKEGLESFSNALYRYRCNIAHGKAEMQKELTFRFDPNEIHMWCELTKDIAEIVIKKYCFPNNI